jgi:hypothetical protein
MGEAIRSQHPAVVLRSHYNHMRALLAVAMIAVVGLTGAVVILATDDDPGTSAGSATQASTPSPAGSTRYDGGPGKGTAAIIQRSAPATFDPNSIKEAPGVRYDGGPDEGTRGPLTAPSSPSTRYDGGPEEGTRGAPSSDATSNAVPGPRYDGGPEEGTRGSGQ